MAKGRGTIVDTRESNQGDGGADQGMKVEKKESQKIFFFVKKSLRVDSIYARREGIGKASRRAVT